MTSYFQTSSYTVQNTNQNTLDTLNQNSDIITRDNLQGTFVGKGAGTNNSGEYNSGIGFDALSRVIGNNNTALGFNAGNENLSGARNVYLGSEAGRNSTMGMDNLFLGMQAGFLNTVGRDNIFLGSRSGYGMGFQNNNIVIGNRSMQSNNIVGNVTVIGHETNLPSTCNNVIYIGGINQTKAHILEGFVTGIDQTLIQSETYCNMSSNVNYAADTVYVNNLQVNGQINTLSLEFEDDINVQGDAFIEGNAHINGVTYLNGPLKIPHPHSFTHTITFEEDVSFLKSPLFPTNGFHLNTLLYADNNIECPYISASNANLSNISSRSVNCDNITVNNLKSVEGDIVDLKITNTLVCPDLQTNRLEINESFCNSGPFHNLGEVTFETSFLANDVRITGNLSLDKMLEVDQVKIISELVFPSFNSMSNLLTSNIQTNNLQTSNLNSGHIICDSLELPDSYTWDQSITFAGSNLSFITPVKIHSDLFLAGFDTSIYSPLNLYDDVIIHNNVLSLEQGVNINNGKLYISPASSLESHAQSTFYSLVSANSSLTVSNGFVCEDDGIFKSALKSMGNMECIGNVTFQQNPLFIKPVVLSQVHIDNLTIDQALTINFKDLSFENNDVYMSNCWIDELTVNNSTIKDLSVQDLVISNTIQLPETLYVTNIEVTSNITVLETNTNTLNTNTLNVKDDLFAPLTVTLSNLNVDGLADVRGTLLTSNAQLHEAILYEPNCPDNFTGNTLLFNKISSSNASFSNANITSLEFIEASGNEIYTSNLLSDNVVTDFLTCSNQTNLQGVLVKGNIRFGNEGSIYLENRANFSALKGENLIVQKDISAGRTLFTQNKYIKTTVSDEERTSRRILFFKNIISEWGSPNTFVTDSINNRIIVNQSGIYDIDTPASFTVQLVTDKRGVVAERSGARFLEFLEAGEYVWMESDITFISTYLTVYLVQAINSQSPYEPIDVSTL